MTFVFYDAMNHVWTHPVSKALLFQGGRVAAAKPAAETEAQVLAVVADNMDVTSFEEDWRKLGYDDFLYAALRDVGSMVPTELEWTKSQADGVATRLLAELAAGRNVLVCCWSGYNRSGLISGLIMKKAGVAPAAAIDQLRAARSPWVLGNDLFCRVIRGEA